MTVVADIATARERTDAVKREAKALWRHLAALFADEVHVALGYVSWSDYCEAEFGMARSTAQQALDAGRVVAAIESGSAMADPDLPEVPGERVARVLAPLLPATGDQSARKRSGGSDERVAAAWQTVVAARAESDEPDAPITAAFAQRALVKADVLPNYRAGSVGKPSWLELVGRVGDDLIAAEKHLIAVEAAVTRASEPVREKAVRYAELADQLASRLRKLA